MTSAGAVCAWGKWGDASLCLTGIIPRVSVYNIDLDSGFEGKGRKAQLAPWSVFQGMCTLRLFVFEHM